MKGGGAGTGNYENKKVLSTDYADCRSMNPALSGISQKRFVPALYGFFELMDNYCLSEPRPGKGKRPFQTGYATDPRTIISEHTKKQNPD